MGSEYAQAIYNLLIVLAVMFSLFFLLKKFKIAKYNKNKFIKVLQVVPVGAKEKIILIEANNKLILLGATASHVEMLHVFDQVDSEDVLINSNANEFSLKLNQVE